MNISKIIKAPATKIVVGLLTGAASHDLAETLTLEWGGYSIMAALLGSAVYDLLQKKTTIIKMNPHGGGGGGGGASIVGIEKKPKAKVRKLRKQRKTA